MARDLRPWHVAAIGILAAIVFFPLFAVLGIATSEAITDLVACPDYISRSDQELSALASQSILGDAIVTHIHNDWPDLTGPTTLGYRYTVDGTTFRSCDNGYGPDLSWSSLRTGQVLPIIYDPADPAVSCSCNPTLELKLLRDGLDEPGVNLPTPSNS